MRDAREIHEAITRVLEANTDDFVYLTNLAGLNPATAFRYADLSGMDFSGLDLSDFDFTGARLANCNFEGAFIAYAKFSADNHADPSLREAADWTIYVAKTYGLTPAFAAEEAIVAEIPRLKRFARFMTRDADYADDLVQECLARANANISSWLPGTNIRAWLFVILKSVFRNDRRRAHHDIAYRNGFEIEVPTFFPAQQHNHLVLSEVQKAFLKLTEEHREVLTLIAIEGFRYEEAASVLNISVGTVKSRLSRARAALRALLGMQESEQLPSE